VYDVTQPETLDNLATRWMADFKQYGRHNAVQLVVGNKIDLVGACGDARVKRALA
jgi:GTPase SAR1 family protein